jgi:hypothetical protein
MVNTLSLVQNSLMMETEKVSEKFEFYSDLTSLVASLKWSVKVSNGFSWLTLHTSGWALVTSAAKLMFP